MLVEHVQQVALMCQQVPLQLLVPQDIPQLLLRTHLRVLLQSVLSRRVPPPMLQLNLVPLPSQVAQQECPPLIPPEARCILRVLVQLKFKSPTLPTLLQLLEVFSWSSPSYGFSKLSQTFWTIACRKPRIDDTLCTHLRSFTRG